MTNGDLRRRLTNAPLKKNVHHVMRQGVMTDHQGAMMTSEDLDAAMTTFEDQGVMMIFEDLGVEMTKSGDQGVMTIFEDLGVAMMTSDVVKMTVALVAQLTMKIVVLSVTIVVDHQGEMMIVIGVADRQVVVLQVIYSNNKLMCSTKGRVICN